MALKKYGFGSLVVHETDYEPKEVIRVTGLPTNSPDFINRIDKQLWNSYWHEKSKILNVEYIPNQDRFDADKKGYGWSSEELSKIKGDILELIQLYNSSAKTYNNVVAKPFIKERKSLLDKILKS